MNNTANFITFEGTEGVGKSTLIQNLAKHLTAQGIDVITTREPGGSPFAEELRSILLKNNAQMADESELLLMFAGRIDHLQNTILPALAQGKWVLCDRYIDSSMAYQGFGRGFGDEQAVQKVQMLIDNFVPKLPDITIWLDLPVVDGMIRAKKRGELDRFEQQDIEFFERIYQGYQFIHQQSPQRFKQVCADGSPDDVLQRVLKQLA